jgi:hypothetical protein
VTNRPENTALFRPSVVAIHNNGNVLWDLTGSIGGQIHCVTKPVIRFPSNQLL